MLDCEIKLIKTHPDAKLPTQGHEGDNCWDLYAVEDVTVPAGGGRVHIDVDVHKLDVHKTDMYQNYKFKTGTGSAVVPVGLKVSSITPGYGFVIKGRSGLGFKHGIIPHFGEIDNGYRGDLGVKMYNLSDKDFTVTKGDRIAQLKIEKNYSTSFEFTEVGTESTRGEGGFGSTGN